MNQNKLIKSSISEFTREIESMTLYMNQHLEERRTKRRKKKKFKANVTYDARSVDDWASWCHTATSELRQWTCPE